MNVDRERVALVTGSAGGMGRAVAKRLGSETGVVFGVDLPGTDQSDTAAGVSAGGAHFMPIECDLTDELQVASVYDRIRNVSGRLDVLANVAGIGARDANGSIPDIEHTSLLIWQRIIAVNLTGTFLVCRGAAPLLKRSKSGRVITIGSGSTRLPTRSIGGPYPASKGGVLAFTRVLALELAPYGVTVNCVIPGLTDTPMARFYDHTEQAKSIPLGRLAQPEDVASAVAFLAGIDASYITGAVLDVNGGTFMP